MLQTEKLDITPAPHDCSQCPDKQRRFCQSQVFTEWQTSINVKELAKMRNEKIDARFWRKCGDYPNIPIA